jgi:transcriptional accessory protein Tex/SPT6
MDAAIIGRIVQETAIPDSSVLATVALFEKGATGPFIVHYRKEATGGLDESKVRLIQERMDYYREVRDKRSALLKSLSDQNKLTDDIRTRIENCLVKVELEDLHHQFRSRKKTRSTEAIGKGLEPLAEYFWNQEPDAWGVEEHIKVFVDASKELSMPEEALQGVVDIIAEWIGANLEYRRALREMLEKDGFVISNVVPAKVNQKTKYNMYYERRESVTTIPSHRVLAIRRGCKEGILISSIEGDHSKALEFLLSSVIKDRESIFTPVLEAAVRESYSRILKPLIETEVRTQLKERADREAIRVFQENLSNLLLSPPAGPIVVMGVDWGKDEECRVAVVSETGAFLEGAKVRLTPPGKTRRTAKEDASSRKAEDTDALTAGQKTESQASPASPRAEFPANDQPAGANGADPAPSETRQESPAETGATEPAPAEILQESSAGRDAVETISPEVDPPVADSAEPVPTEQQSGTENAEGAPGKDPGSDLTQTETQVQPEISEASGESSLKESAPEAADDSEPAPSLGNAMLTTPQTVELLTAPPEKEAAAPKEGRRENLESEFEAARETLKKLIIRHKVRALSIGAGTKARELESALRRIIMEENLGDILIAAVNDTGIAIYSSSRIAREEFPDWNPSARCAVSLARRLQDPLSELVKIDPKLIGVGQYQHDVDQKELHRKLLRTVQFCVNKVGVNVNSAGESLLRYVSGLNEKIARRITAYRNSQGAFPSRESISKAVGMDSVAYEQAAAFLRIPDGTNILDRTSVHPESYPIVQNMASALGMEISALIGNREKVASLKLEDFATDTVGIPTLKDIREELLKPGRDPRKTFKLPKFRADVTDMSDLKTGMILEGTVTNVTNFGAFVDIGVRQDGLVHLSQMSNRFIKDPREAVKVGDIVQVKVISIEAETKRIGLSMKTLLPAAQRKRRKQQRNANRQTHAGKKQEGTETEKKVDSTGAASSSPQGKETAAKGRLKPDRSHGDSSRSRTRGIRKPEKTDGPKLKKESAPEAPEGPEPSLQEKIAILQSKFRRIK